MIKSLLKQRVDQCFLQGVEKGLWTDTAADSYAVEVPKRDGQGDFSTNLAMVVAGKEKRNPREVAAQLLELLGAGDNLLEKVEIAGPGFVNFFLNRGIWSSVLPEVLEQGTGFGRADFGNGKKVLVEFVSANPTGPLSVGHGRNAILGDTIARILSA